MVATAMVAIERKPMILTPEDIADLKIAMSVTPPAFYKDNYSLSPESVCVARVLRRHGVAVDVNGRTGEIKVRNP